MNSVVAALIPVFLLIVIGWAMRRFGVVEERHWPGFEAVTYKILFPAVVIETLARANLGSTPFVGVGAALIGSILITTAALLMARRRLETRFRVDGPAFTSIAQGAVRWNTFVALALAAGLHGRHGVALSAVAVATMIPLLNVLSVWLLLRHGSGDGAARPGFAATLRMLLANPFIWSSLVGFALNAAGDPLPRPVMEAIDIVGRAALGAGLLLVGSGLMFERFRSPGPAVWIAVSVKLLAVPAITTLIALGFGVSGPALVVTVICAAVPTATASYIMARQLGGDAPLMADITTWQTLIAMLTLPVWIVAATAIA